MLNFAKNIDLKGDFTKIYGGQLFTLITLLALVVIVIYVGLTNIPTQLETLKEGEATKANLKQKLSTLDQIESGVLEQSNLSIISLPEKNSAPFLYSLIKSLAENHSITIQSIGVDKASDVPKILKGSTLRIKGVAESDLLSIGQFVKDISTSIPVSSINIVKIDLPSEGESGDISFTIEVKNYWANLPEEIPPISEPIDQLSQEENELLRNLATFKKPELTTLSPSEEVVERDTPFN